MAHRLDAYRPRDWAKLEERLGMRPKIDRGSPEPVAEPERAEPADESPPRTGWPTRAGRGWGGRRPRVVVGPAW